MEREGRDGTGRWIENGKEEKGKESEDSRRSGGKWNGRERKNRKGGKERKKRWNRKREAH